MRRKAPIFFVVLVLLLISEPSIAQPEDVTPLTGESLRVIAQESQNLLPHNNHTRLPFSFFASSEWENVVDSFQTKLNTALEKGKLHTLMRMESGGNAVYNDTSDILIDGIEASGISLYDAINGKPNKIFVEAPGLANVQFPPIIVYGDEVDDEVILDGCLKWSKAGKQKSLDIWHAVDSVGVKKTIWVNREVKVTTEKTCTNSYFLKWVMGRYPFVFNGKPPQTVDAFFDMGYPETFAMDKPADVAITEPEDMAAYETSISTLVSATIKEAADSIVSLMKKKLLPGKFPEWLRTHRADEYLLNHIYLGDNSSELVEHAAYRFANAGTSEVYFLQKNWGQLKIGRGCSRADLKYATFVVSSKIPSKLGGIGVSLNRTKEKKIVLEVMANHAAANAGVKSGDVLVSINGVDVRALADDEVLTRLRGLPETSVSLGIKAKEDGKQKVITFKRGYLGPKTVSGYTIIQTDWPFRFSKFLVFGDSIGKGDIKWSRDKKRLINIRTNDTINFNGSACYNLVFTR